MPPTEPLLLLKTAKSRKFPKKNNVIGDLLPLGFSRGVFSIENTDKRLIENY